MGLNGNKTTPPGRDVANPAVADYASAGPDASGVTTQLIATFATRVAIMALGLASSTFAARLLGPSGTGEYYVVVTFAAMLVQFGNLGLPISNTYLLAKDRGRLGGLLANSLWATVALGGAMVLLAILAGKWSWLPSVSTRNIWLGAAIAVPSLWFMLGGNLLLGLGKVGKFNTFQFLNSALLTAAVLAAWALRLRLSGLLVALVAASLTVGGCLLAVLVRTPGGGLQPSGELLRVGLRYALKAYVACGLSFLLLQMQVLLLDRLTSPQEVGYYSVACRIRDVLMVLPAAAATVLFPHLVRAETQRWRCMIRHLGAMAGILAAGCLLAGLLARPFIAAAFGRNFLPAAGILWWMLPAAFFYALTSLVSQYLGAIGIPRAVLAMWAAALGVGAAGGCALIPSYGGVGAAAALSLSCTVAFLLQFSLAASKERLANRPSQAAGHDSSESAAR